MNVADLHALLVAAKHFADAAGNSQASKTKLTEVCEALEPFRSLDISAFVSFLRQAEEYQRTGVLPVASKAKGRSPAKAKPSMSTEEKAQQVENLVKQLQDLYGVVHEETVGYGAIDDICEAVDRLNVPEVKKVAQGFGIKLASKATKKDGVEQIRRKLTEQKGSAQRIQPISEKTPTATAESDARETVSS